MDSKYKKRKKSKYTIQELLRGVQLKKWKLLMKKIQWLDEGKPVGRE